MNNMTKINNNPNLHLFVNDHVKEEDKMRCYKNALVNVEYMTMSELFGGFEEIRAITFSYDIPMIGWLMEHFQYGEILLGADFLVRKDAKTATWAAEILSGIEDSARRVGKYDFLVQKMINGDLVVHSSTNILDHRKLYLLKSDNGRTRVITASANMTKRAWSLTQMETVSFYDDPRAYEFYAKEFDSAWNTSVNIPYEVASSKEADDPTKVNAAIKQVKETGKAVILQVPDESPEAILTDYQYVVDMDEAKKRYQTLLKDTGIRKTKEGFINIVPKTVEKIKINAKKAKRKKVEIRQEVENYPKITFDYDTPSMLLSGKEVDLQPSSENVKNDIQGLLSLFKKYNSFVGTDPKKQKDIYYKLLNVMFASPFFARLRCEAKFIERGTTSLPLYLLISSIHASTGKTFFVKAILKMMTGKKNLSVFSTKECLPSVASGLQIEGSGVPIFIDEINNRYLSHMETTIKASEQICEMRQQDDVPMLIFASNDVTNPDMKLRKRMIFLNPEGTIPSDADQTGWLSAGNSLISRLGSALYREYIRRMIPKVWNLIDEMQTKSNLPETWYPDIMPLSSETLLEIMEEYGYGSPDYFRRLTWRDDFAENAAYIAADAFREIEEMYQVNKKAFIVSKDTVTVEVGTDTENKRRIQSWANIMPTEVIKNAPMSSSSGMTIIFNRAELEKRSGITFHKKLFGRR